MLQNNAASGLPVIDPSPVWIVDDEERHNIWRCHVYAPFVLLHESKDFSLTAEVAVTTPTGEQPLAGNPSVTPAFGLWNNFTGGWVVRGVLGVNIPTQGSGN